MKNYIFSILGNKKTSTSRADVFYNQKTGVGAKDGRVESSKFSTPETLKKDVLTDLYRGDGITRRIVGLIVDDSLREFVNAEIELHNEFDRIKFKQVLSECGTFARLYGGSLMVAFVDDGASDMSMPINMKRVRKVVKVVCYDRHDITWEEDDINVDFHDSSYGEPNIYTVTPSTGERFKVHKSRVWRLGSISTPSDTRVSNGHWDDSAIQPVYSSLLNYGLCRASSSEMAQDFVQKVLSVEGLADSIRDNGSEQLQTRLAILDFTLSNSKVLAIDAEREAYNKHVSSAGGISELWDRFSESICASSGIPMSRLFSRNPSGLTNNSNGDDDHWHSVVDAYREDELSPCIDWIIELLKAQLTWEDSKRPVDYEWEFPSLQEASEEEMSRVKHLLAQVDSIYVNMGAVDPRELYALRYATGKFQVDITMPDDKLKVLQEPSEIDINDNEDLLITKELKTDSAEDLLMKTIAEKL